MNETLISTIEHHVTFAGVLSMFIAVGRYWLKERDVYKRVKSRLNDLWWGRCAERQEGYTPVENGMAPVVPPIPHRHGD